MTAYYSRAVYANGGAGTYAVPFPYLNQTHVTVLDNGAPYSGTVTWPTPSSITLTPDISADHTVEVRRVTPKSSMLATFTPGSIQSADLNTNNTQLLYDIQEAIDLLISGGAPLTVVTGGTITMGGGGVGGAVTSVNTKTGAVVLSLSDVSGMVSITTYGAKCDGNPATELGTDDLAAWTAAIADINAGVITGLWVPGYSLVSGALPTFTQRCSIRGLGPGTSGIIYTGSSNVTLITFDSTGAATTQAALQARYMFDGLFIGTKAVNTGAAMSMHSHNSNFENILSNLIVSGWPTHQASLVTGIKYGFARGIELINTNSSYFVNIFMQGYHDPVAAYPLNNLVTTYGWNVWAEAGKGSFNNRWTNVDVAAVMTAFEGSSGNLQGFFFESFNPGFCGYGWVITPTGTTNPPCFNWVDCQTEVFYDSFSLTNMSYVMVSNCLCLSDSYIAVDRAAFRLNNVFHADIGHNEMVCGNSPGSGTHSFLIATDCNEIESSFNKLFDITNYGVRFNGTTQYSTSFKDKCVTPTNAATPYKNDSSNNTTNKRRNFEVVGGTAAQGSMPQTGTASGSVTLAVGGTTIASTPSFSVEVGDRLRVEIAVDITMVSATFTQVVIKETNHVGSTVTNFALNSKNWTRYQRLDSTVGRNSYYESVEFDIVLAEPDAIMTLAGFSGTSDAITGTTPNGQIKVTRL